MNKNAFQWDAYCLLVDCIPTCTVGGVPRGCVCPGGMRAQGGCLPRVVVGVCPGGVCLVGVSAQGGGVCPGGVLPHPPCGQTDTRENITFTNFVCGR